MHIVVSEVRRSSKKAGLRVSAEFLTALDNKVARMIEDAAQNCSRDGRGTLRPIDVGADSIYSSEVPEENNTEIPQE